MLEFGEGLPSGHPVRTSLIDCRQKTARLLTQLRGNARVFEGDVEQVHALGKGEYIVAHPREYSAVQAAGEEHRNTHIQAHNRCGWLGDSHDAKAE